MKKHISIADIKKFKKEFESCNHCKNTMNGLTRSKLEDISMNWESFRTIDHNFYTKLLGSHGIVGFCIFMNYFYSLLSHRYTHFSGLRFLQLFFVYFILFAPPGPCMVLVASFIYYFDTQFYPNKKLNRPINMVVKSESYLKT